MLRSNPSAMMGDSKMEGWVWKHAQSFFLPLHFWVLNALNLLPASEAIRRNAHLRDRTTH